MATTKRQLGLFAELEHEPEVRAIIEPHDRELAAALPRFVRLGTSTWTFPGWANVLYQGTPTQEDLVRRGLAAYASNPLFRTVGIDRSYYGPLGEQDLARYAENLAGTDFLAVSKVWSELTTFVDRTGKKNPSFLSPERFIDDVLAPYTHSFARFTGPFVFELPPIPEGALADARVLPDAIAHLLERLPATFRYAFELRNRELLTPRYFDVLRAHRAAHCFNMWTAMPPVGRQLALKGSITTDVVVCRLMLPPATRYEQMKKAFEPFNRIVRAQPEMRDDVVRLAEACDELDVKALFILANNKAEGCSPLTVKALAEALAPKASGP